MHNVIDLTLYRERLNLTPHLVLVKNDERPAQARARSLIRQAAELLSDLDQDARRVSWLLEDCVALLPD